MKLTELSPRTVYAIKVDAQGRYGRKAILLNTAPHRWLCEGTHYAAVVPARPSQSFTDSGVGVPMAIWDPGMDRWLPTVVRLGQVTSTWEAYEARRSEDDARMAAIDALRREKLDRLMDAQRAAREALTAAGLSPEAVEALIWSRLDAATYEALTALAQRAVAS